MTINEGVYSVLKELGVSTDDYRFPKRFIYRKIKITANELVRQEYDNLIRGGMTTFLDCVDMNPADRDDCKNLDGDFSLMRSCKEIPKPLDTKRGIAIVGIFTLSGHKIPFGTLNSFIQKRKLRFQPCEKEGFAFIKNNRLYVAERGEIDCLQLSMEGFYEDPEEVAYFNEPITCQPVYERQLVIPGDLARRVFRIVRDELAPTLGIPIDNTNNAKDDTAVENNQGPSR